MWASAWTHMGFHHLKSFESFLAMPPTTTTASGGFQIIPDEDARPNHVRKNAGVWMVIFMFTISASGCDVIMAPKLCVSGAIKRDQLHLDVSLTNKNESQPILWSLRSSQIRACNTSGRLVFGTGAILTLVQL